MKNTSSSFPKKKKRLTKTGGRALRDMAMADSGEPGSEASVALNAGNRAPGPGSSAVCSGTELRPVVLLVAKGADTEGRAAKGVTRLLSVPDVPRRRCLWGIETGVDGGCEDWPDSARSVFSDPPSLGACASSVP